MPSASITKDTGRRIRRSTIMMMMDITPTNSRSMSVSFSKLNHGRDRVHDKDQACQSQRCANQEHKRSPGNLQNPRHPAVAEITHGHYEHSHGEPGRKGESNNTVNKAKEGLRPGPKAVQIGRA